MEQEGYKILGVVGKGPASTVYLASDASEQLYAAKVYQRKKCPERDWLGFHSEAFHLAELRHPCLVALKECFMNPKDDLVLVSEYCQGGNLNSYIHAAKEPIPEELIIDWLAHICLGLRYIHKKGFIHRDIKSTNIFLTKEGRIKIGDFGACRFVAQGELLQSRAGTPTHLPPEVFSDAYGEGTNKSFTVKQDMWALGVVLYEACCMELPFQGNSMNEVFGSIKTGQYPPIPEQYSEELESLINSLLSSNEALRPSANEILQMDFVRGRILTFLSDNNVKGRASQLSRFQQLLSHSPQGKPLTEQPKQERSTSLEQNRLMSIGNPETSLFEVAEKGGQNKGVPSVEELLFSTAVLSEKSDKDLSLCYSPSSSEGPSWRHTNSKHNITFGAIQTSAERQVVAQTNTPNQLLNAHTLNAVSPNDFSLNNPVISLPKP